jgi:hypothetical protein
MLSIASKNKEQQIVYTSTSIPNSENSGEYGASASGSTPVDAPPSGRSLIAMFDENQVASSVQTRGPPRSKLTLQPPQIFENHLNGSWDLVLSVYDKVPSTVQKFESGQIRREVLFEPNRSVNKDIIALAAEKNYVAESTPSMWGLSRSTIM